MTRAGTTEQRAVMRARIILRAAEGAAHVEVADELGVSVQTILLWRRRFKEQGLAGLADISADGVDRDRLAFLDDAFEELARDGRLAGMLRPKGSRADAGPGVGAGTAAAEDDRRFDALTRELLYEGKAQPGERTLSAAELAELERHRLQALEAERVARQRVGEIGSGQIRSVCGARLVEGGMRANPECQPAAQGSDARPPGRRSM